jgi:hypothetical protein
MLECNKKNIVVIGVGYCFVGRKLALLLRANLIIAQEYEQARSNAKYQRELSMNKIVSKLEMTELPKNPFIEKTQKAHNNKFAKRAALKSKW